VVESLEYTQLIRNENKGNYLYRSTSIYNHFATEQHTGHPEMFLSGIRGSSLHKTAG